MGVPKDISFTDYLEILNVAYEWVDSYDSKDWKRLETILGPAVTLDMTSLGGALKEGLTPAEFAAVIGDRKVIGDPRVKTQHLLGGSKWHSPGDSTVQVWWQLRVAHQRYAAVDLAEPINKGHGHGINQHTYKKIDGVWKLIGVNAMNGWVEGDLMGTLHGPDDD